MVEDLYLHFYFSPCGGFFCFLLKRVQSLPVCCLPPCFPPTVPPASQYSVALHGHTKQSLASLRLTVMGGGRALVFVCAAAGNF